MSVKYICDGCGKESGGEFNGLDTFKPSSWYSRNTEDKELHACSRACIEKINKKRDENTSILPW